MRILKSTEIFFYFKNDFFSKARYFSVFNFEVSPRYVKYYFSLNNLTRIIHHIFKGSVPQKRDELFILEGIHFKN